MLEVVWQGEALKKVHRLYCDEDAVYWLRKGGFDKPSQLYRLGRGDGAPRLFATDPGLVRSAAFDKSHVYLAAIDRILRLDKRGGGRARVLVGAEPQASDLIADEHHLYWTNPWFGKGIRGRDRGPLDGTVRRMSKQGGDVETILGGRESLKLLGHDDGHLYLSSNQELIALPKQGGAHRVLLRDERNTIMAGVVAHNRIYITIGGELRSVSRRGGAADVLVRARILLEVAALGDQLYVARNLAFARGAVAQKAALLRIGAEGGEAEELAGISHVPVELAACASTIYVVDAPMLGRPGTPRLLVLR